MPDEDDATSPEPAAKMSLRGWSAQDKRLMIITFAATLVANVLTVAVIGLAVAVARFARSSGGLTVLVALWVFIAGAMAGTIIVVTLSSRFAKPADPEAPSTREVVKIYALGILLIAATLAILVLVGIAAGIK